MGPWLGVLNQREVLQLGRIAMKEEYSFYERIIIIIIIIIITTIIIIIITTIIIIIIIIIITTIITIIAIIIIIIIISCLGRKRNWIFFSCLAQRLSFPFCSGNLRARLMPAAVLFKMSSGLEHYSSFQISARQSRKGCQQVPGSYAWPRYTYIHTYIE